MKPQIAHEAEIHRQHVRLRIPIAVEIDGNRFTVDDWSMGGLGVDSPLAGRKPGERFPARLLFPFEDFELTLRLEAQLIYVLAEPARFGSRFVDLSQGQLALFRYIVDAYLSGEIVSGGDILSVVGGDEAGDARVQRLFATLNETSRGGRARRYLGIAATLMASAGLVALVLFGLYQRFLVVTTERAVIEAPTFQVAATAAGVVEAGSGGLLHRGDLVARLVGPGKAAVELASPCECVLDAWLVAPGANAQPGQAVASLVAADQPLTVRAQVPVASARWLKVGQTADVTVPGKARTYRGQIARIDFRRQGGQPGEPLDLEASAQTGVTVIVSSERPFDFADLGFPVAVSFR